MPKGVLLSVESSRVLRPHLRRFAVDRQVSLPTSWQLGLVIDRQTPKKTLEI